MGLPPGFQKDTVSLLLPKLAVSPLLRRILVENHPFLTIFRQHLDNPPMFRKNLPKKDPCVENFWAQKLTNMGGTYPCPEYSPARFSHFLVELPMWCHAFNFLITSFSPFICYTTIFILSMIVYYILLLCICCIRKLKSFELCSIPFDMSEAKEFERRN